MCSEGRCEMFASITHAIRPPPHTHHTPHTTPTHTAHHTHHTHTHTQELELTARAHGIATPSMTTETQKLAEAAEQALG